MWLAVWLVSCDDAPAAALVTTPLLPSDAQCDSVRTPTAEYERLELELRRAIATRRADGTSCGGQPGRERSAALADDGSLWCAARLHSQDMADGGYLDHVDSENRNPFDRLRALGYRFYDATEVIAAADIPAADVVDQLWLPRAGSCESLLADEYEQVGIGYARAPATMEAGRLEVPEGRWTVVLAIGR